MRSCCGEAAVGLAARSRYDTDERTAAVAAEISFIQITGWKLKVAGAHPGACDVADVSNGLRKAQINLLQMVYPNGRRTVSGGHIFAMFPAVLVP